MSFSKFYDESIINIPIHFESVVFNDDMSVKEITIPDQYISHLIEGKILVEASDDKNKDSSIKWKDKEGNEKDFEVALGNVKIGGDTIILNMSTASGCMSAMLGLCSLGADGKCYARRQEVAHPNDDGALGKNKRHEQQWSCLTPDAIATGLINVAKKIGGIKFVRFNEAGEFRNLPSDPAKLAALPDSVKADIGDTDDVGKLKAVAASLIRQGSDIVLYTYTHRSDLNVSNLGPNVCINGSGFMLDNAFVPVEIGDYYNVWKMKEEGTLKGQTFGGSVVNNPVFCMGDCRVCKWCKVRLGNHIFIPIHGSKTKYNIELDKLASEIVDAALAMADDGLSPKELAASILETLPQEQRDKLRILIPVRNDRIAKLASVISGKSLLGDFLDDLLVAFNPEDYIDEPDIHTKKEAISASIDAMSGKIKEGIALALQKRDEGKVKDSTVDKWNTYQKQLDKAINSIAKGKPEIGKQIAGLWKRQKAGTL